MKSTTLIIVICLSLFSCSGQIKESFLIGEWKVIEFSADTPELSHFVIEAGREEALSSVYVFNKDGQLDLKSGYYLNGVKGTWNFNPESKELTISYLDEEETGKETNLIQSLSESKMIWVQNLKGLGTLTFTLTKE